MLTCKENINAVNTKQVNSILKIDGLVGLGSRIHQLHLWRGVRFYQSESWYDTKQSDAEASVMLKLRIV